MVSAIQGSCKAVAIAASKWMWSSNRKILKYLWHNFCTQSFLLKVWFQICISMTNFAICVIDGGQSNQPGIGDVPGLAVKITVGVPKNILRSKNWFYRKNVLHNSIYFWSSKGFAYFEKGPQESEGTLATFARERLEKIQNAKLFSFLLKSPTWQVGMPSVLPWVHRDPLAPRRHRGLRTWASLSLQRAP